MNPLLNGMGGLDPSKMSPQTIAAMTELMRSLTPEQMMKMQCIMHNAMAGFDTTQDMIQFESTLPSTFREKMAKIMYMANGIEVPSAAEPQNMDEARLVILRSVAGGLMTPEQALKILFLEA